jgi:hypothetical protein
MPQINRSAHRLAFAGEGGGRGAWPAVLPVSLAAWVALLAGDRWLVVPAYCIAAGLPGAGGLLAVEPVLRFNPPQGLAAGWLTMLAATMLPLIAAPLVHVRGHGLGRRGPRAVALFLVGYVMPWMAAGAILLLLAIALNGLAGGAAPFAAAAAIALAWQASPWKQACLNRCHDLPELPRSGIAADRHALRFGLGHGLWCAGACWALMAVPLTAGGAHLAAMALVALLLFAERIEPPRPPAWGLRWPRAGLESIRALAGEMRGRASP